MTMPVQYPFLNLADVNAPYMREIEEAVQRVVTSGRYIGGVENQLFEEQMKEVAGAPYVIGVSNGLDALRLILRGWIQLGRLKPGDEVIVAANTYVASVLAIVDAGLVPVLAEPSLESLNLDTERLEEYLTPRTRAIMPVHLYGRVVWDSSLVEFVRRKNLLVIEDNAQAIGAEALVDGLFGTRKSGGLGHAGAFSFYPTKNIGAMGDAGAVVTHDPELAMTVRALSNYGSDRRYHNIYVGFNCRLDPLQAAILKVKLPHLSEENGLRRERASLYDALIANPAICKPHFSATNDNVWHQYVVRTGDRGRFVDYLRANGVETDIHYAVPPHRQPALQTVAHTPLPVTQMIADTVVSLPISRTTSLADVGAIGSIINRYNGA